MTKDVLLSISGLHQDVTGIEAQGDEPGSEGKTAFPESESSGPCP